MGKKKLLLIGSTSNPVHIENYYHLIKEYFDEVLIVGSHEVSFCQSKAMYFGMKNPIKMLGSIRRLRKIMQEFNPDIVHVHQANTYGYITSLANKKRYPHVLTTWGDDVLIFPKKGFILRTLSRVSLKYADAITADAQIMAKAIHDFVGRDDVIVANFGIEIDIPDSFKKKKQIYSNRLHDGFYNIDQIISGAAEFIKDHPDWTFVLAGKGSLTEELKAQATTLIPESQFKFVGFVDAKENKQHYLDSDYFVSIPDTDGTAVSLLECMAFGCIPIVSDLPSNREWIEDGVNGIVTPPSNVHDALHRGQLLDMKKVQDQNLQIIKERATKEANRAKFTAIYDRLLRPE